ncbi:metallophosphoesterase [Aminipila butyrica]|uniref:Metallophosphoesterase n=1 Tax=Aminipila butyrica TaxID=433296 RepID=A0A858BUD1_9FIRM|nr:metallophosphoesterase [Aminipila butyrica]QIB68550.1 metallophosphoesterase [Aminipila butyrica]
MKKTKGKKRLWITAIAVIFILILLFWGNTAIQITPITIEDTRIPSSFDGFTIVQVSDLHNAEFGNRQERLLHAVKSISPDMIAITGDLIDSNHTDIAKAMAFIKGSIKIAPVYYVTGNHEARTNQYAELKQQMIEAGVIILSDESTSIKGRTDSIQLIGLDDPSFTDSGDSYERAVQMDAKLKALLTENNQYTVLLSHRPELFDMYVENNINLVLSGHAHGGQVRLPFIGGIIAPNQGFFPRYSQGLYKKEQTNMVVSRGLGNSIMPLRINNRPELIHITFKVAKGANNMVNK